MTKHIRLNPLYLSWQYLRELERGPLGNSEAELFKNCEVRVYRLEAIEGDNTKESRDKGSLILQSAERIASSAVATW